MDSGSGHGSVDPRAADPEIGRSLDVGGVATNYHDAGEGRAVLLVHGSGPGVSAWANWRGTIPDLSRAFRVLAPDVMGFGYTSPPDRGGYTVNRWCAHLVGFLDALGIDRVSVVGNSFGGALTLHLAARHPDRVRRLVLMGSVGVRGHLTPGLDQVWGFTPSLPNMRRLLDLFAYDADRVGDELAAMRLAAATRPGVHEAFSAMFPAPRQAALDALDLADDMIAGLEQPTLIVHGRDDRVIPLANSLRLLQLITASQLHVFGQCGHWVQIEHQVRFNALVAAFLAEEEEGVVIGRTT